MNCLLLVHNYAGMTAENAFSGMRYDVHDFLGTGVKTSDRYCDEDERAKSKAGLRNWKVGSGTGVPREGGLQVFYEKSRGHFCHPKLVLNSTKMPCFKYLPR